MMYEGDDVSLAMLRLWVTEQRNHWGALRHNMLLLTATPVTTQLLAGSAGSAPTMQYVAAACFVPSGLRNLEPMYLCLHVLFPLTYVAGWLCTYGSTTLVLITNDSNFHCDVFDPFIFHPYVKQESKELVWSCKWIERQHVLLFPIHSACCLWRVAVMSEVLLSFAIIGSSFINMQQAVYLLLGGWLSNYC